MRLITSFILMLVLMPLNAGLEEAIKEGKLILDLRFRIESVDQENLTRDALAPTLRTRLGYETAALKGWSFTIDFEDITVIGDENYNSTNNGLSTRPVVADPEDTELNRAHLTYSNKARAFILGRQRIILDNSRFVGNVGWRQNEQTYDALIYQENFSEHGTLTLTYVANVNRIFGEHHQNPINADLRQQTGILHYKTKAGALGDLALFAHLVDLDDLPLASHRNLGVRLDGQWKISEKLTFLHDLSYVNQTDYADGDSFIDADYYSLSWGPKWGRFSATANYEVLGSNQGLYGFATPLATLHAFNGWADLFLNTPKNGLKDSFLKFTFKQNDWSAVAMYHNFKSDFASIDYGDELDLMFTRKLNKKLDFGLKAALFDGDALPDVTKIWAWSHYQF